MDNEQLDYRHKIKVAISQESPTGEKLNEDPVFDFVEQQMMKVGSLAHGEVKWREVETSTLQLLSTKSKDIRLLVFLMQCLHFQVSSERLTLSFLVMADFVELYWDTSYPVPGNKGKVSRKKFLSLMVQRLSLAVDKLDFSLLHADLGHELREATDHWHQITRALDVCNEEVDAVHQLVENRLKVSEQPKQVEVAEVGSNQSQSSSSVTESRPKSDNQVSKKTLLDIAGRIFEQESGDSLSIRLRRFAIWGTISSPPEHKADGETMLRGMNQERLKEYRDQLNQPTLQLWQQIEQSLTLAPFWFDGQLLSYVVAERLDKPEWCSVIAEETANFLSRVPLLNELKFKGGEPFVSEDVKQWLEKSTESDDNQHGEWQMIQSEAFTAVEEKGIAHALSMLNDGLASAQEPREQFYWRLISADIMHDNNLTALAQEQYRLLYQQASNMQVSDWEPHLIHRLQTTQRQSK